MRYGLYQNTESYYSYNKKAVRKNNSYDCLRKDETIIYSRLEPFLFIFPKRFQHYKDITPFPYCL